MGTRANRRVITFYSFKGGVGRTMTLANIAHRLAFHHGLHVIAVDWDLEAPGLHSFFKVPAGALENARGLLDYCEAWETSYQQQAPEPPNPLSFLVPVEPEANEEHRGALRLLIAGRQDEHYDARLGRFDWKRFYAESAGAGAVEHLRNRLAEDADLVLVDSRTGLTDPGGICTIQIPDAVVLMTAPNEQSLEGIERIAQSIAAASPEARVGKDIARVFLCMSRVPIVEETHLARQWFKDHEPWFKKGVDAGLWSAKDHRLGLETHVIPQRAAYGFGESLVGLAVGTLEREPLAQAYDKLAHFLLQWKWENIWSASQHSETDLTTNLEETAKDLARARKRRDVGNLVDALERRASALRQAKKLDEALAAIQEAVTLAEGLDDPSVLAIMEYAHGSILFDQERYAAARDACQKSLDSADNAQNPLLITYIRAQLGRTLIMLGQEQEGTQQMLDAIADIRANGDIDMADKHMATLHAAQLIQGQNREIVALQQSSLSLLRENITLTRQLGDAKREAKVVQNLLALAAEINIVLPDEPQLRQRLVELEGPLQSPLAPAPVKAKRRRAKG